MAEPRSKVKPKKAKFRENFDGPWKAVIGLYLAPLIALLNPKLYAQIDWQAGATSLDASLPRVTRGRMKVRVVDKLFRLRLRNGGSRVLLIHIEVQAQKTDDFAERVSFYGFRIYEAEGAYPLSVAILADGDPDWRPTGFGAKVEAGDWESEFACRFPTVKLVDFEARRAELEALDNPFAWFILAHLDTLKTRRKHAERSERKFALAKAMLDRMPAGRAQELLAFVDCLMALPAVREERWYNRYNNHLEERGMRNVSIFERKGIAKGKIEGKIQGKIEGKVEGILECVKLQLDQKFGKAGTKLAKELALVRDVDKLLAVQRHLFTATTAEELLEYLK